MKKKLLFLMSDTGGGHRAAALALSEAIEYLYPDQYEIIIEDIWKKHLPWPFNLLPNTYGWMTGPGLPLWQAMWFISTRFPVLNFIFELLGPLLGRRVCRYMQAVQPDIVVSVHPLMNHLGVKWLKTARLDVPFITVVTDLVTFHPSWICPQVTRCLVPTEPARERALQLGMPAKKLAVYGQPVALKFANSKGQKSTLRHKLNLAPHCFTALLVGGGEGFGPIFAVARQIAQEVPQAQLLIVAGRNRRLLQKLEAVEWEIPTRVFGFVDNMPELMGAADVVITKAGPGTISEAFIAGVPPLLLGYIPGQESGNVAYVQENGAGVYAETPADIANLIHGWQSPQNPALSQMAQNAARLARPQASLQIATDLCRFVWD